MGVTELWSVLSPVRESVPLYSLTGKTLAVDLSLWICEAQHVQAMIGRVTKPHLRNLFFRASSLLRMGVKLVFVMEGEAPKIKAETMSKRTDKAFRGSKTKSGPKPASTKNTGRGRFKAVLRECAEMLDCLGIPWVAAAGEAEAMCAFLDAQGLVDGCITSDGDAFLYGAQTVYRNFNMNTKDPQIDCYKMSRVETELNLKRETLVGLAMLLGCDYIPKGVAGVGKEQTLKLIQNLNGQTLLQKFSEWNRDHSETLEVAVKKVGHCIVCRHPGSAKTHERSGCVFCDSKQFCNPQDYDSQCPCDWHRTENARQSSSIENNIKKKTLACDKFPFTEIITEFLVPKDKAVHSFKRRKPNLFLMQNFALDKMEWPKHYTSEKVLVLMTYTELMNKAHGTETTAHMEPLRIYKRRIRNGISCFEVLWRKPDHFVFPEDSPQDDSDVVRTVEEENLFSLAYPHIVQLFHKETTEAKDNKSKRKKQPKPEKEKPADSPDVVSNLFAQMSLQTSKEIEGSASLETVLPRITALKSTSQCPGDTLEAPKSPQRSSNQHDIPEVAPSPCPTATNSQAQSSPSVSAVLNELHLSSIDWEALSFTASPSQPTSSVPNVGSVQKLDEGHKTADCISSTAPRTDAGETTVPKVDNLPEVPLRERILMRKIIKISDTLKDAENSAQVLSTGSERTNVDSPHIFNPSCKLTYENKDLHSQGFKSGPSQSIRTGPATKTKTASVKSQQPIECLNRQVKLKYTFVKPKHALNSSGPPQRSYSDPFYNRPAKEKKSVCVNLDSSSEESDVENHCRKQPKKDNLKVKAKPKPHLPQKTVPPPFLTKEHRISSLPTKKQQDTAHINHTSDSDGNDSDVFINSPLPLAERLKLKIK
ncbi:flap endonuclease GEN homolog 1 [Hoplias malabaricus]|uniref:flap endonuclease GEN homolog 1 n=1 Tax=Hoplias malabaricus TaxID=27720 RepID=UPI003461F35F